MIEQRRNVNSQFDNQLEQVNTEEEFFRNVPEVGALISVQGAPFYGNGQEWKQLAFNDDIPTFANGYQVSYDTEHINEETAQILTTASQVIENDNQNAIGSLGIYNGARFRFRKGVIYTVTISFTAKVSTNNAHAELYFSFDGIPYNGDADVLTFVKGNNVYHQFSRTYQIVGDEDTESGILLYIKPSHEGKIRNAKYTIQQAF
jgi:hypothetical protein